MENSAQTAPADNREPEIPPDDSRVIADLAGKMQFVGLFTMLLGGLVILFGLIVLGKALSDGFGPPPSSLLVLGAGGLFTAFGFWTRKSGGEFLLVDETHGRDVTHVMVALINLTKLYTVQYWLCIAGIGFFALVVLFTLTSNVAR